MDILDYSHLSLNEMDTACSRQPTDQIQPLNKEIKDEGLGTKVSFNTKGVDCSFSYKVQGG